MFLTFLRGGDLAGVNQPVPSSVLLGRRECVAVSTYVKIRKHQRSQEESDMSSKGFRILGIGLVVLLAGAGLFLGFNSAPQTAEAQDQATTTVQLPRTITVVGEGTVAVEPDVAEVQIGVEMTGDTADEARAGVATTMDAIMAALTSLKIPKKDIQTSGFSIYVERPTTPDGLPSDQVIYHVSNNVTVTIRDLATEGPDHPVNLSADRLVRRHRGSRRLGGAGLGRVQIQPAHPRPHR